ncbi:hypothetical protein EON63_05005 [archaeon]|nr:MAG: hypothetical protein EON63_05005 [archaeon]
MIPELSCYLTYGKHANESKTFCLVSDYLYDVYRHPDLSVEEIEAIEDMFGEARQKGWLK